MRRPCALAVSLCVLSLVSLVHGASRATTFTDLTLEDLAKESEIIVLGRVVATDVEPVGPRNQTGIHTRVTLAAEEYLQGPETSLVTFWVHGGRLGNLMRVVPGQARFRVGERVLVFLTDVGGGILFPAGMSLGKWEWRDGRALPPSVLCGGGSPLLCQHGVSLGELRASGVISP